MSRDTNVANCAPVEQKTSSLLAATQMHLKKQYKKN